MVAAVAAGDAELGTLHLVRAGTAHFHFLPPIPTAGLAYEDRDRLAVDTRNAMADLLQREYGVLSPPWDPRRGG